MGCLNDLSFLKVKYKTKTGKQTNKPPMAMLCSWAWGSKVRSVGQHGRLVFSCCQMPRTTGVQMAKGCAELFTAFSRNANTSLFHPPFWHHYLLNSKSIAPALPSCCGSMFIFSRCASFMAFGLLFRGWCLHLWPFHWDTLFNSSYSDLGICKAPTCCSL